MELEVGGCVQVSLGNKKLENRPKMVLYTSIDILGYSRTPVERPPHQRPSPLHDQIEVGKTHIQEVKKGKD